MVLWKEVCAADDEEEERPTRRMFARAFPVFNIVQVDGYEAKATVVLPAADRHAQAEAFIANLSIRTVFGGDEACYRPTSDTVHMPRRTVPRSCVLLWCLAT